jgi:hypothetical protein
MSDTDTQAAAAAPSIRIISRAHEGFRRGGVGHPADASYPAGHFTDEQLALIESEPLLTVIYENGAEKPKPARGRR